MHVFIYTLMYTFLSSILFKPHLKIPLIRDIHWNHAMPNPKWLKTCINKPYTVKKEISVVNPTLLTCVFEFVWSVSAGCCEMFDWSGCLIYSHSSTAHIFNPPPGGLISSYQASPSSQVWFMSVHEGDFSLAWMCVCASEKDVIHQKCFGGLLFSVWPATLWGYIKSLGVLLSRPVFVNVHQANCPN